jgi:hypothetical protein
MVSTICLQATSSSSSSCSETGQLTHCHYAHLSIAVVFCVLATTLHMLHRVVLQFMTATTSTGRTFNSVAACLRQRVQFLTHFLLNTCLLTSLHNLHTDSCAQSVQYIPNSGSSSTTSCSGNLVTPMALLSALSNR